MHHGNPKISRDRDPVELRAAVRAEGVKTCSALRKLYAERGTCYVFAFTIFIICSGPQLAPSPLLRSCRARRAPRPVGPLPEDQESRGHRPGPPPGPPAQPAVASTPGRRLGRPDPGRQLAGDPSPLPPPPPQRAPPPSTHRGAPSRVPDADARPTLTAAAAAAAAAAEGWSSPFPSPTARGRPAKPPPPPLQLQPRPRQPRPPRPRPRTSRPAAARPLGPSPLARAPGGRGRAPAAGGAGHWLSRARRRLSASPRPANCPEPCRTC
ncbi:actin nucleation-promoting factor WAS-like [Balaenoptera acutorostrata]|uniref:Actin nucleation-promoting factor WAS-like n=1 Tax=Balaenoptera acutorostrata TaxID=9767 RepID=A0ABM3TUY1_BALAC|nr:actin nucleation-promoting factor WAS-like [Balaenoptera acutorostrata]